MNSSGEGVSLDLKLSEIYSSVVGRFVSRGEGYALLDFPNHFNVGDSAIYCGETIFFDKHVGRPPSYVCLHWHDVSEIELFSPDGPIFIHGGGNFGDIWPQHQEYRHRVLQAYPNRKVIQLPQSIHYNDNIRRDETARIISAHGNFTLLVRDEESYAFATKHFDCEVQLCPDAAHNILQLDGSGPTDVPVISFLREDREAQGEELRALMTKKGPVRDWPDVAVRTFIDRVVDRLLGSDPTPSRPLLQYRERRYRRHARARVLAGAASLKPGALVVSDRLHVHIIASLMKRDHIVLDNSYGKICRYIDAWGESEFVTRVDSVESLLNELAARGI